MERVTVCMHAQCQFPRAAGHAEWTDMEGCMIWDPELTKRPQVRQDREPMGSMLALACLLEMSQYKGPGGHPMNPSFPESRQC